MLAAIGTATLESANGGSQRLIEADGDRVGIGCVCEVFAEDDERISRQARDAVAGPQHCGQPFRDSNQQLDRRSDGRGCR